MQTINFRFFRIFLLTLAFVLNFGINANAQSKPQRPDNPRNNEKKNERPDPKSEEEKKRREEEQKQLQEEKNAVQDTEVLKIDTKLVNLEAVVYNKKSGQIITGLKKDNFAIFENGVKQEISNFTNAESPITISLVLEYSKWSEVFGSGAGRRLDEGKLEVIRPVAYFLSRFIKAPDDYASVIAFDIRPTPITDFTNDPARLRQTIDLLLRNNPAFRENNLFDAIKFALVGGVGDTVVLENAKEEKAQYAGMVAVKSKRRALILVASGIDTFSKINYDQVRKIVQSAGIPIYIISTGNLFYKLYEGQLEATDSISGLPGRLTFLQAQNTMNTIAKESGGQHFPMTFEGEIPNILQSINGLLRNQYSLAYDAGDKPRDGKKYKLEVRVDINGDGVFEGKEYIVQHRPFYTAPNDNDKNAKK